MCVNWCLVVLSGRGAVGWWLSALGRTIVQGELQPNPSGACVLCVCFYSRASGLSSNRAGFTQVPVVPSAVQPRRGWQRPCRSCRCIPSPVSCGGMRSAGNLRPLRGAKAVALGFATYTVMDT